MYSGKLVFVQVMDHLPKALEPAVRVVDPPVRLVDSGAQVGLRLLACGGEWSSGMPVVSLAGRRLFHRDALRQAAQSVIGSVMTVSGTVQLAKMSSSLRRSCSSTLLRRVSRRPKVSAGSSLPSRCRCTAMVSSIGSTIQYSSTPCLPYSSCL